MRPGTRLCAAGLFATAVGVVVGCGKKDAAADAPGPAGPPPMYAGGPPGGPPAAKTGNAVFDQHCLKCHAVDPAAGAPKGMGGPNLAKVAADPAHTAEWLAEHVRNPKGHKPGSRMPAFEGKLSADELKSVVDYMQTLKGPAGG